MADPISRSACLAHEQRQSIAKVLLRFANVVRPAPELKIPNNCRPADRVWLRVMELQEAALRTPPVRAHERALAAIALPHLSLHRSRNVTRSGCGRTSCAWSRTRPELGPLQIGQEQGQRPIEDGGRIAVGNRVTQQILCVAQLVVCLARHGELHFVALGREWGHGRRTASGRRRKKQSGVVRSRRSSYG